MLWDPRSKPRGLLGGHINIRSLVSKSDQIEHLLNNSNLDFLGVSETWLSKSSPEAAVNVSRYNVFRKDRDKGRGGGVLICVKDTIKCNLIEWSPVLEIECLGLSLIWLKCHLS